MGKEPLSVVGLKEIVGRKQAEYSEAAGAHVWAPNVPNEQRVTQGLSNYPQMVYFLSRFSEYEGVTGVKDKDQARRLGSQIIRFDRNVGGRYRKHGIGESVLETSRRIADDYFGGAAKEELAEKYRMAPDDVGILLEHFYDRVTYINLSAGALWRNVGEAIGSFFRVEAERDTTYSAPA